MSDSEEENYDLTTKLGLASDSEEDFDSDLGSASEEGPMNYQDEIVSSDDDTSESESDERDDNDAESNVKAEKKSKSVKKKDDEEHIIPNLELSDGDDDLKDILNNTAPQAKKVKKGTFQSFGLSKKVLYNVTKKGYRQPTPIQRKAIPHILAGRDVLGMARTGSGKTAAFLLPIIEKLKTHSAKVGARCVILSPNRELALQTFKSFKEFSKGTGLRSIILVGGDSLDEQFTSMLSNPDIIIATPGRFLHLRTEMSLDLKSVQYIVFDEADQLFETSFEDALNDLILSLPSSKQAILFSATLPKSLVNFAKVGLSNPLLIRLDSESKISDQLEMAFVSSKMNERDANLLYLIQDVIKLPMSTREQLKQSDEFGTRQNGDDSDSESDDDNADEDGKRKKKGKKFNKDKIKLPKANELVSEHATIVFVPTKHHVEYIKNLLRDFGYAASFIYGTLDQHARKKQLLDFKTGVTNLLVVTDVAARGIDIPLLKYVINYTLPTSSKLFIHRVGRTARAGNTGFAYTIVTPNEVPSLVELEIFLGKKILTTSMFYKKQELLQKELKVSFTDRLVLGSSPRYSIEDLNEIVTNLLKSNYDLRVVKEVSEKAEKLYYKTKSKITSQESLKRSKELLGSGWDDLNLVFKDAQVENEQMLEKEQLLEKLQNRKKKETVFEFNKNEDMINFMNRRRKQIEPIQKKALERKKLLEKERLAGLTHTLQDEILKGDENEVGFGVVAEKDLEFFEDADEIVSKAKELKKEQKQKQKKKQKDFKDKEFFLSHYAPVSDIQDKQYEVGTSFANEAQNATFDMNGDDGVQIHKQNQATYKWDKSKKKYVNSKSTDTKYIISESGQRIPATYKSGRFDTWKNENKINGNRLKVGSAELQGSAANDGKKFKHNKTKAPKLPDRFRDDYHKQKKKVVEATEKGMEVKGYQAKGMAKSNGINSFEKIQKERELKQKRRDKNGRPSKKRKF